MIRPNVSVIMSVFNNEKTVSKSIESILSQKGLDFELLVIDDCSTDKTYLECKKYKEYKNFKLLKNDKNIGLTKSLNLLIEKTNGDFIARQDGDDYSLENRLSEQYYFMLNKGFKVSYTMAKNLQTMKNFPRFRFYLPYRMIYKKNNPFVHGTLMIERELLIKLNKYNEKYYYAQDYKLLSEIIKRKIRIGKIFKPLYVLNTKNNISELRKNEQKEYARKVRNNI